MTSTDGQFKNGQIQKIIKSIAVPQLDDSVLKEQIAAFNEIYGTGIEFN